MSIEVNTILLICLVVVFLKSIIIGSEFDFTMWFRDGSSYLDWYRSRPKYQPKPKKGVRAAHVVRNAHRF